MLANLLCADGETELAYPVDGNEVFAVLSPAAEAKIKKASVACYPWPGGAHRFVCNWATPEADLDALRALLAEA